MTTAKVVRVRAHAKINLSVRVGGVRVDGYHELQTVFQALAMHDTLTCVVRPGPFAIRCDDAQVPADERNLVWRAAAGLWDAQGRKGEPRNVEIALAKQIPVQAGLGGGSADGAAALAALSRVWRGGAPVDLAAVAARVGADVPYFLVGGTAIGLSRGDDVYPLPDLPRYWVVLGVPGFGVPTADAYNWLDRDRSDAGGGVTPNGAVIRGWPGRDLVVWNDLERPVGRRHPEIGQLRDLLTGRGALAAAMTGSGSAVFGLFGTQAMARRAAVAVAEGGWMALLTRTVGRRTSRPASA